MAIIETYPDSQTVQNAIQSSAKSDLQQLYNAVIALRQGCALLVSAGDQLPGLLDGKLTASGGCELTVGSPGADETLALSVVDATETVAGKAERATPAEAAAGTDDERFITAKGSADLIAAFASGSVMNGQFIRPQFSQKDTDELYIGPGAYHLSGKGVCYWNSTLTFQATISATRWEYLYLDYSEISAAGVIDVTKFIHSGTAPAWSGSAGAWMNGSDRCIFAFYTKTSGSKIIPFLHDGNLVVIDGATNSIESNAVTLGTSFVAYTLNIPAFVRRCLINWDGSAPGANTRWWRQTGATGTVAGIKMPVGGNTDVKDNIEVVANASKQIDAKQIPVTAGSNGWNTMGYYFGRGI
jgi:hypothetical protein